MFGACSVPRLARAAVAACFAAAILAPSLAHADEPLPPEVEANPDVLPSPGARTNVILAGGAITLAWYGVAVASSYGWSEADHASSLRIPFAGPFIGIAHTGCGKNEGSCQDSTIAIRTAFSVLSAVGQIGGVAALLEGVFLRTAEPGQEKSPVRLRRASVEQDTALHFAVEPAPPPPATQGTGRETGLNGLSVSVFGRF